MSRRYVDACMHAHASRGYLLAADQDRVMIDDDDTVAGDRRPAGRSDRWWYRWEYDDDDDVSDRGRSDVDLSDEGYADGGDDEGGGHAEDDVLPEGEVVGVARRPPSLLAHDQVRRRPQERQVARHRAHPRQEQPRPGHRRRRDRRRRSRHLVPH